MKRFYLVLLSLIAVQNASAQGPVSVEDFKKKNSTDRAEIIAKAPPAQKAELGRLHVHLNLLREYGSEEAVKLWKESAVATARGFLSLARLPSDYMNLWRDYRTCVIESDEKAGMTQAQLEAVDQMLSDQKLADTKHIEDIHDLVFHLAPSSQAFELEKKAAQLRQLFRHEMEQDGSRSRPLRREDLVEAGKQIDALVEQLKRQPVLTQAQLQREYDDFPESKIW